MFFLRNLVDGGALYRVEEDLGQKLIQPMAWVGECIGQESIVLLWLLSSRDPRRDAEEAVGMQSLELRRRFQGGDKHSGVGSRHGILTEFLFLELRPSQCLFIHDTFCLQSVETGVFLYDHVNEKNCDVQKNRKYYHHHIEVQ